MECTPPPTRRAFKCLSREKTTFLSIFGDTGLITTLRAFRGPFNDVYAPALEVVMILENDLILVNAFLIPRCYMPSKTKTNSIVMVCATNSIT